MIADLKAAFEKHDDEFLKFDAATNHVSGRPDLCAFLVLERLCPHGGRKMVCAAEHDQIWLDADCEKLAEVATDEDILLLARCGIFYDDDVDSLSMYA